MARESSSVEISGVRYDIAQLGAVKGRRLFVRLGKAFAPALSLVRGVKKLDDILERQLTEENLNALADCLDEQLFDELCSEFARLTTVHLPDGRAPNLGDTFDDHFAGNYGDLIKWFGSCLKLNFAGFLGSLGGTSQSGAVEPPSQSQTG